MKKIKVSLTLAALAGVAVSSIVLAQVGTSTPVSPSQSWIPYTSSGYVGGSIGRSDYDLGNCTFGFSCDDRATGFKLYTGGKFSRYFGVELGYVNLGKADRGGGQAKAQGGNLSLVGSLPLTPQLDILGRVGGIYSWTKTSTLIPGAASGKDDGLGLSYGAGIQYDISKSIALRADWDRYRVKYVAQRDDADLYSLGVVFKF